MKPIFWLGCYGYIVHGTGNSAQLWQNFGISGRGVWTPNLPRYATDWHNSITDFMPRELHCCTMKIVDKAIIHTKYQYKYSHWIQLTNTMHWLSLPYSIRRLLHVSASMYHLQGGSYVLMSYLMLVVCVHTGQQHSQYMTNNITNSAFK
jgi:hypothetical protein